MQIVIFNIPVEVIRKNIKNGTKSIFRGMKRKTCRKERNQKCF